MLPTAEQARRMKPQLFNGVMIRLISIIALILSVTVMMVNVQRSLAQAQLWKQRSEELVEVVVYALASRPAGAQERWLQATSNVTGQVMTMLDADRARLLEDAIVQTHHNERLRIFRTRVPNSDRAVQIEVPQQAEQFVRMLTGVMWSDLATLNKTARLGRLEWFSAKLQIPVYFEADTNFLQNVDDSPKIAVTAKNNGITGSIRWRHNVVVGPFSMVEGWNPQHLIIALFVAGGLGLALAIYLFRPYQRQLSAMSDAAQDISRGLLDARVNENVIHDWVKVSRSFNLMAAQIEELLSIQQEMLSAVSHELRTPVARIRFGLEMLHDMSDGGLTSYFTGLDSDIEELDRLVDEIITYAKLHRGQPRLQFKALDIDSLMQQVRDEAEQLGSKIEVIYEPSTAPKESRLADGEERYVHRVVQNFTNNALRHAETKVRLQFNMTDERCLIRVCDDGPGIPPQDRERVFSPFTRLDDSRTRSSGGYGLGLSIVRRIADWHHGEVEVQSNEWGGASFVFSWPRLLGGVVETVRETDQEVSQV